MPHTSSCIYLTNIQTLYTNLKIAKKISDFSVTKIKFSNFTSFTFLEYKKFNKWKLDTPCGDVFYVLLNI